MSYEPMNKDYILPGKDIRCSDTGRELTSYTAYYVRNIYNGHILQLSKECAIKRLENTKFSIKDFIDLTRGNIISKPTPPIDVFLPGSNPSINAINSSENDEIAKVMSDLIQIIDVSISEYEKSDKDFLKIGFSDITGAGNDAFVNENFLYEAMRDDLKDCIVENTKDVMTLIYHIRSPQLLYKFEALKKLFVESIILSQVVYGGNNFVIYSPTEVRVFGLP